VPLSALEGLRAQIGQSSEPWIDERGELLFLAPGDHPRFYCALNITLTCPEALYPCSILVRAVLGAANTSPARKWSCSILALS
jgi:hypothetical protein